MKYTSEELRLLSAIALNGENIEIRSYEKDNFNTHKTDQLLIGVGLDFANWNPVNNLDQIEDLITTLRFKIGYSHVSTEIKFDYEEYEHLHDYLERSSVSCNSSNRETRKQIIREAIVYTAAMLGHAMLSSVFSALKPCE